MRIDLWLRLPDAALTDLTLADRLAEIALAGGADPRRIVLALERAGAQRDGALHVLTRLRVKGFGLCLDDLGGPAHRAAARPLPLTAVRLDAELVTGAHADPQRVAMLQEWIDLAATLGPAGRRRRLRDRGGLRVAAGARLRPRAGRGIAGPMPASGWPSWASSWSPPLAEDSR